MKKYFCERCGHEWIPRVERKPKACPGCKNYRWNKKRRTGAINYQDQDSESQQSYFGIDN